MSSTIELIRHDAHGNKGWKRFQGYQFALGTTVVQLSAPEVAKAAVSMPLAFMEVKENFSLVAVCGLNAQQNLFIAPDGRWVGAHVPAVFRGYPFKLARTGAGDDLSLCIDTASGLLVERDKGEPFYNEDGTPSEAVRKVMEFLIQTTGGQEAVNRAATALSQHGVLEPWPIKISDGEQERDVNGLLRVNERAFNALGDEAFLALRKVGGLQVAYAQLLSSGNINILGRLAQTHQAIREKHALSEAKQKSLFQATSADEGIDWGSIFAEEDKN